MSADFRSPLRYPGGKSKAIDSIAPLIPDFAEYREPFVGGGSVYFYIRQKYGDGKKYWINDLFWELYNFWKSSQSDIKSVAYIAGVWKNKYNGIELYRFLKRNWYKFSDIEKASAFFILNRITFAGGTLTTGYSVVQYEDFIRSAYESKKKDLLDAGHLLSGTIITNYDYQKVVEEPGDDVFLFLDPPYYSATSSGLYGKSSSMRNTHKMFDHYRFMKVMKKCEHNFLITYDDSSFIRKQFEWATIIPWELIYGMRTTRSNVGKELFITNMDVKDVNMDVNKNNTIKTEQLTIDELWG